MLAYTGVHMPYSLFFLRALAEPIRAMLAYTDVRMLFSLCLGML